MSAEVHSEYRREYRKQKQTLKKETDKKEASEEYVLRLQKKLEQQVTETESILSRMGTMRTRPAKPSGICDWAEQNFGAHIVIHERARRMMKDIQNDEVDMNMLCDSLEYLANEHWDILNGIIDESESKRRCSLYYDRPFEVSGNSDRSIRDYPDDYVIQYSKNGRATDAQLTSHLKVGKDPMRLVRIYFFYDKEIGKIVIGSMPKHLRIVGY